MGCGGAGYGKCENIREGRVDAVQEKKTVFRGGVGRAEEVKGRRGYQQ